MTAPCSSGRCAMHADRTVRMRLPGGLLVFVLLFPTFGAVAAEAPLPPPPEAEAAHQDLKGNSGDRPSEGERSEDEAIFTEISPLTIPEIGVALPADQEH